MTEAQRVDLLEKLLARLLQLIVATDTKLTYLLAVNTAMVGALAAVTPKPASWTSVTPWSLALAGAPVIASFILQCVAAVPRTKGVTHSIIFFESIRAVTPKEYLTSVRALTETSYAEDLAEQCHRNSEIASAKYHYVKLSIWMLMAAIPPWAIGVFLVASA